MRARGGYGGQEAARCSPRSLQWSSPLAGLLQLTCVVSLQNPLLVCGVRAPLPRAAVTTYHGWGSKDRNFLPVLEAGSPRLGCCGGWFLRRSYSLSCRCLSSRGVLAWCFLHETPFLAVLWCGHSSHKDTSQTGTGPCLNALSYVPP